MRFKLYVIAAGILFGTTGTAQAFAPATASSLSIGSARLGFGGLLLAAVGLAVFLAKHRTAENEPAQPSLAPLERMKLAWPALVALLLGACSVMGYQATFFAGTRANGVAVGTVLAIGSSPMFAGLFEWIVLKVRPTLLWLVLTLVGIGGVYLLSATGITPERFDPLGVAASLGAGASYAAYTVCMRVLLERGWESLQAVSAMLGIGAILAFGVLASTDTSWLTQVRGIAVISWLAVVTVVVTYILNARGLSGTSAAMTATLTLAEPATASTLGIVILHESIGLPGIAGMALVVGSVLGLGLGASSAPAREQA
ncbi:MAG: DMT family transporter [Propionibacteriaceae bacterium]|nr:DMT family transporter [Propionibacteriaceae bacterium]